MAKLSAYAWEKLLARWTGLQPTGEVKFICAIIASAIDEEPSEARLQHRRPFYSGFFTGYFFKYCKILGLDPEFVIEQVERANSSDEKLDRAAAKTDNRRFRNRSAENERNKAKRAMQQQARKLTKY